MNNFIVCKNEENYVKVSYPNHHLSHHPYQSERDCVWEGKPGTITPTAIHQASTINHNHSHTPPGSSTNTGIQPQHSESNSTFGLVRSRVGGSQRDMHHKQQTHHTPTRAPGISIVPVPPSAPRGVDGFPAPCPAPPYRTHTPD